MRTFILLSVLLSAFYLSGAQPVIQVFAPRTAPAGTTINIIGSGFSSNPAGNIVYFGPVKAIVSSASTTSLSVTAPLGASYHPISVTVDSLTAVSAFPFSMSFPEALPVMNGSFEDKTDLPGSGSMVQTIAKDLDGDGKTDLVVANYQGWFSIYKNNSTPHNPLFAARVDYPTTSVNPSLECGDIDGDGRLDLVVTNYNNFEVYRNTSTPGNISFAPKVNFTTSIQLNRLTLADADGDGKTDILATTESVSGSFSFYKNTSSPGIVRFAARKIIPTMPGKYIVRIVACDLNSDGKPELAMNAVNALLVYKNISDTDTLAFSLVTNIATPEQIRILFADFNRDGKTDIASSTRSSLLFFQNTTLGADLSFEPALTIPVPNILSDVVHGFQVADFDGDEWPDIAFMPEQLYPKGLFIMSNQADGSSFVFGDPVPLFTGLDNAYRSDLTVLDIDNDSKPDLVSTNTGLGSLSLFLNKANQPIINTLSPSTGSEGTLVTMKGFNFNNTSAVRFGNTVSTSFTVVSDTVLTATAPAGQTGLVYVTNPYGDGKKDAFTYDVPAISLVVPAIARVGDTLTVSGSNFAAGTTANTVTMGAVSCRVIDATNNEIKIVVPHGSSRQPLTVTSNGLSAYYDKTILLPFEERGPLASNSFAPVLFPATGSLSGRLFIADLNEDGKPDLLSANYNGLSYSLLRNTSNTNNLSFAPKVDYPIYTNATGVMTDDMDGDGKTDLLLMENSTIKVRKNNSVPGGAFNFNTVSAVIPFGPSPFYPNDMGTGDFDRDGRPDVVATTGNSKTVTIFKNKSLNGTIAFYDAQNFACSMTSWGVFPADLNNDGNTDLAVFNTANGIHRMILMKNTTPAGADKFSFDTTEITIGSYAHKLNMADIDGDGYKDLCLTAVTLNKFSVYRNLSNGTNIAFAPAVDFTTDTYPRDVYADDLDGDGIIDIVCGNETNKTLSVFKGTSVPGTISFAPRIDYQMTTYPLDLFVTDLDADGRPDIAYASNGAALTVVKNKVGIADIVALCPGGSTTVTSNITGADYKWHQRIGTQFVPIDDNANYAGTNTSTLQLNNLPSSFTGNEYSCLVNNGSYSNIIRLSFRNSFTGAINGNWEDPGNWSCGSVPDMNTDVVISSGNVLVNSNITIRSLILTAPATITVTTGNTMTILH